MANEINLFGPVGRTEDGSGVTSQQVKSQLAAADQSLPLIVRIDSEGGSVFDGLSIYEAFANYPGPKKAVIESTAFSIASYIAMAFDDVEIAENGYVMIHEPASYVEGTAGDLTKNAELLAKLDQSMVEAYARKTGLSEYEARELMKDETFMNASEALNYGFVNSISSKSVATRIAPQARHKKKLPQRVFTALFGAGSDDGDTREKTKELPMSDTPKIVAASVKEIKAAFPKMKAEFVLSCIEKQMPMASVATAAAEELMAENEELVAKCSAMEEELTAIKAKAMECEDEMPAAESEEEPVAEGEEEQPAAKATARGSIRPVARSKAKGSNFAGATAKWNAAIEACLPKAGSRQRAVIMANRDNPGLREQMLAEHKSTARR